MLSFDNYIAVSAEIKRQLHYNLFLLLMFGLVFIASVVSLVGVSLKSFVTCSAPLTKAWPVDGEVYKIMDIKQG